MVAIRTGPLGPVGPMGQPGPVGHTGPMIMQEPLELEGYDDAVSIPAQPLPQPTRLDMLEEGMSELKEQNEQLRDRISRLERKWWRKAHEALCSVFEAIDARLSRRGNPAPTQCIIPGSDNDNPRRTRSFCS